MVAPEVPCRVIGLAAILTATLSACSAGGPSQVSQSGAGAFEASVTPLHEGLGVAWYDTRDGNAEIYIRLLGADGRIRGPEHRLTNDPEASYEADIVGAGEGFAVAWYDKSDDGTLRPRLGLWSETAESLWTLTLAEAGRNPVVRSFEDALLCAWIEDLSEGRAEVWAGWWDLDGRALGAPIRLAAAGATTWNLNAAIDTNGRAYVVFDAKVDSRSEELYLARLTNAHVRSDRLTADDGFASKYPDLVFAGDQAALTWFDERDGNREVYLTVARLDDLNSASVAAGRRVTSTPGDSIGAYLAWNANRLGLAWSDNTDGQHEVYFQAFGLHGEPLRASTRLTRSATDSLIPSIQPWRTGFALAWNELESNPRGVHAPDTRSEIEFAFVR